MTAGVLDVIVAGAGTAGAAAAFTLAGMGARVLVVDAVADAPSLKIGESLCGQGVSLLKRSGLLDWARRSEPLDNPGDLCCWGSPEALPRDFIFELRGQGWHLDRAAFDAALRDAARDRGAAFHEGRVRDVRRPGPGIWEVRTAGGAFRARRLVDATGRRSVLARRLGARRIRDAPLVALYAWGPDRSDDARTIVEAVASGWWYSAPLPGGRRVCVKHTAPVTAKRLLSKAGLFSAALQETLHLKTFCQPDGDWTPPRAADASGSALDMAHGPGWLAIGDAAASFDPLSAHGLLNALAHGVFGAAALLQDGESESGAVARLDAQLRRKRHKYLNDISNLYLAGDRWGSQFYRNMIHENLKNLHGSGAYCLPSQRVAESGA